MRQTKYHARRKGLMHRLFPNTSLSWEHYMLVSVMAGMVLFILFYWPNS